MSKRGPGRYITVVVEGYSYLRRIKGRKSRKRITVPGYSYRRWIPKKKPRKRKPTKQKPTKKKPTKRAPKRKPVWVRVPEFVTMLEMWADMNDFTFEVHNSIKNQDSKTDWVSPDGFVWPSRTWPTSLEKLDLRFIAMAAVWVLVYNRKARRYQVWSRVRSFGLPDRKGARRGVALTIAAAKAQMMLAYKALLRQIGKADYVEAQEPPKMLNLPEGSPLAWTLWGGRMKPKEDTTYIKRKRKKK